MRSSLQVFVVLCLLPLLVAAQNTPAYADQQNQVRQDQSYDDQPAQDQPSPDQAARDQAWQDAPSPDEVSPEQASPGQAPAQAQDAQSYDDTAADQGSAPAPVAAAPQPVKHSPEGYPILEDGTPVRLRLDRTLSSADCQVGDRVDFKVIDPVVLDGVTVIPAGSMAWGKVVEAEHKKRLGRGGKLAVMIQSVRLANSERAPLRAMREAQGGGHQALMSGAMIGTAIVFLPVTPVWLLMHGKDVKIQEGTEITAYVNGDTTFAANPSVYAPGAAPAPARSAVPRPTPIAASTPAPAPQPRAAARAEAAASLQDSQPMESVPAEAAPMSTELRFTSNPDGAMIELDGAYIGRTPSTLGVPSGQHTVRMSKDGYRPYEKTLDMVGDTQSIHADLQSAQ